MYVHMHQVVIDVVDSSRCSVGGKANRLSMRMRVSGIRAGCHSSSMTVGGGADRTRASTSTPRACKEWKQTVKGNALGEI